ncbi:MAG: Mur ligase family protein, partial [Pseudomonadota bacterium]
AAGRDPGFLIGGVPANFDVSARAGSGPFVVEADEYDTAFFDKRAKFVHYRPDIAVLNNLEFDHADIYSNLGEIQRQFHHLVRTVPGNGRLLVNAASPSLAEVLEQGAWTPVEYFADGSREADLTVDYGTGDDELTVRCGDRRLSVRSPEISGRHGLQNLAAALLAVRAAGVPLAEALAGVGAFQGVRRRLERLGRFGELTVYDDFAHHPTAIRTTLAGLRRRHAKSRLLVALELRSNTMRLGTHAAELADSLRDADLAYVFRPADTGFDAEAALAPAGQRVQVFSDYGRLAEAVLADVSADGDTLVLMSNGAFGGLRETLPERLAQRAGSASPEL